MEQTHLTFAFSAGKSGGHIVPCLELIKRLKRENSNAQIIFFAANSPLDKKLLNNHPGIIKIFLPHASMPGKNIFGYPLFFWRFLQAFYISLKTLWHQKPQKITSTGELISIPVCLAAWILRIPVDLYELNVIPGKTIKLLSFFARKIYCCFEETKAWLPKEKCFMAPYPLRFQEHDKLSKEDARKKLAIDNDKKVILIMGGSQGSLFINQQIKAWLDSVPHLHTALYLLHQTGGNDSFNWTQYYSDKGILSCIFSYNPDTPPLYCAADLIICRAGAGTLFEVGYFGTSAITIPLEIPGNNHQLYNALSIKKHFNNFQVYRQKESGLSGAITQALTF